MAESTVGGGGEEAMDATSPTAAAGTVPDGKKPRDIVSPFLLSFLSLSRSITAEISHLS
jgi:hypothetical protein